MTESVSLPVPAPHSPTPPAHSPTLGVVDILSIYGLDATRPTKLVRHQDRRYDLDTLIRNGWFELYQSYQRRPAFHGAERIVSFYGTSGTRAILYGVYRVLGHHPAGHGPIIEECVWSKRWHHDAEFFYDLERDRRFDHLRDRLVIEWGGSTRAWFQNLTNKPVLAIEEPGRRLPVFDDYLGFSLTHAQLVDLFANEEAHRDWRGALTAVAGIYLILAEPSGDLYVGSACGSDGIWGRWREYARAGHGNNALLRRLVAGDATYPGAFRFSVLQVLPQTMSRDEIIRREQLFKEKLGTRATGLNLN